MSALHVVPLASVDGEFGGPMSVAISQCQELARRGIDVLIAGGWTGRGRPPEHIEGVRANLFPIVRASRNLGFPLMLAPALASWVDRRSASLDVVHIHTGRHLLTLDVARRLCGRSQAYLIQTHGMVPPTKGPLTSVFDLLLTAPALKHAGAVLALTPREERELAEQFGSGPRILRLANGLASRGAGSARPAADTMELLFLGRLHARKRPRDLVAAFSKVAASYPTAILTFVGPDEGELAAVLADARGLDLQDRVTHEGPLAHDKVADRLRRATAFVLPSVDEPFPITLLEAMSVGTPVICTTSCGLAADIVDGDAGWVVDPTVDSLTAALTEVLANPANIVATRAEHARTLMTTRLSIEPIVDRLLEIYASL